jgi:hypothetical protein
VLGLVNIIPPKLLSGEDIGGYIEGEKAGAGGLFE